MAKEAKKVKGPVKIMAKIIQCDEVKGKEAVYTFRESLLTYEEALNLAKKTK